MVPGASTSSGSGGKQIAEDLDRLDELIVVQVRGRAQSQQGAARIAANAPIVQRGAHVAGVGRADREEPGAPLIGDGDDLRHRGVDVE